MLLLASIVIGSAIGAAMSLWPQAHAVGVGLPQAAGLSEAAGSSGYAFIFRFDPALPADEAFEVFTIPTTGAAPDGVAVHEQAGVTEIWFAESGADQIGRLTYTDTTHYAIQEYELPQGSRPLNIAVDDTGRAWFTEFGRSRIGRIDGSTGVLHQFVISTTDVGPWDLGLAPDGSVWFTERNADRIGQLVVTSTSDYEVNEFSVLPTVPVTPSWSDVGLLGILVEGNDEIWAALSEYDRLAILQPSVPRLDRTAPVVPSPAYPFRLVSSPDHLRIWFTELRGNHITGVWRATQEFGLRYIVPTANSGPYDIDVDSSGAVWFSEQLAGKIGRLVVTTTATFSEFDVPLAQARVQGLEVDSTDVVWCVADTWHRAHLPLTMRQ